MDWSLCYRCSSSPSFDTSKIFFPCFVWLILHHFSSSKVSSLVPTKKPTEMHGCSLASPRRQLYRTKMPSPMRLYQVVGRKSPTATDATPTAYRMKIFAPNAVMAESRFWYFMHQMRKMKKTTGEILDVNEVRNKQNARENVRSLFVCRQIWRRDFTTAENMRRVCYLADTSFSAKHLLIHSSSLPLSLPRTRSRFSLLSNRSWRRTRDTSRTMASG